jgi:hypothetical protein
MLGHMVSPSELLSIGDEEEPEDIPNHACTAQATDLYPSTLPHYFLRANLQTVPYSTKRKNPSAVVPHTQRVTLRTQSPSPLAAYTSRSSVCGAPKMTTPQISSLSQVPAAGTTLSLACSWFGSSSSRSGSDKDAEAAQSLLGCRLGVGYTPAGERPMISMSTKSAISGNTVCHDAVSRMGTPVSLPSRAITPASQRGSAVPE